jgi:hypothetical protein
MQYVVVGCLIVLTFYLRFVGIGGDSGWGVILDEVQKALLKMTLELDEYLARLVAMKRIEAREQQKIKLAEDYKKKLEREALVAKTKEIEQDMAQRAAERERAKEEEMQKTGFRRRAAEAASNDTRLLGSIVGKATQSAKLKSVNDRGIGAAGGGPSS